MVSLLVEGNYAMQVKRTEFGTANSVYRRDAGLKLRQVAEYLGVTPAFLSSVEVGRKPIPEEWFDKLTKLYKLDALQCQMLRRAGLKSQKRFVINDVTPKDAELLAAFVENRKDIQNGQLELALNELIQRDCGTVKNEQITKKEVA